MRTAIAVSMFVALVCLGGCMGQIPLRPTIAKVHRFVVVNSEYQFRACTLTLGWTREELWQACGVPDAEVLQAGASAPCYAYHSVAHSLGTTDGVAPVMLACLEKRTVYKSRDANSPQARQEMITEVVTGVYGVSKLP